MRRTLFGLLLPLGLALFAAGCGDGSSSCESACRRIANCYAEVGTEAPECTLSKKCPPSEKCTAGCIKKASCGAILGSDLPGKAALASCIMDCASSLTSDGQSPRFDGGPLPEGGLPDRAIVTPLDEGISWPDYYGWPDYHLWPDSKRWPDSSTGKAVVKFCNNVTWGGSSAVVTAKIGSGSSALTLSAGSGSCDPPKGTACPNMPTGSNVPVELFKDGSSLGTTSLTQVNPGEEHLLTLTVDSSDNLALEGGTFRAGYSCKDNDPFSP